MPVKANIDKKFLLRLGLIALFLLGVSLWFLYDGTVKYPRQRERALEYQRVMEKKDLKEEDRLSEWLDVASRHGWPAENPGEPKEEYEIHMQLGIAALAAAPGLLYAFFFLRARGRWIEMNETGLRTSWGRQLEFDQIVSLDKKKWKTKGIAKITYQQNGRRRQLVLDDWKYYADPTKAILCEVESRINADQIVGGDPEPVPSEKHEEVKSTDGDEAT